jgi:hypothetical protein|tara:strand:+ start:1798 stop:1917 length:120 start_codon:yes stop_codon:yes gene_type:complete
MLKRILKWFMNHKESKERERKYKKKVEDMKKQDPFIYKH